MSRPNLLIALHGALTFGPAVSAEIAFQMEELLDQIPREKEISLCLRCPSQAALRRHFTTSEIEPIEDASTVYWQNRNLLLDLRMDELLMIYRFLKRHPGAR